MSKQRKAAWSRERSTFHRADGRVQRRVTLYLPDDLHRRLRVYCAENDREMSEVVTEIVRRFLGGK